MSSRKRYAVVGTGGRSGMFIMALAGDFADVGELVGFCDPNQTRMDFTHLFRGVDDDPLGHAAGHLDGARSILVGIAANQSMRTGLPVNVAELVAI